MTASALGASPEDQLGLCRSTSCRRAGRDRRWCSSLGAKGPTTSSRRRPRHKHRLARGAPHRLQLAAPAALLLLPAAAASAGGTAAAPAPPATDPAAAGAPPWPPPLLVADAAHDHAGGCPGNASSGSPTSAASDNGHSPCCCGSNPAGVYPAGPAWCTERHPSRREVRPCSRRSPDSCALVADRRCGSSSSLSLSAGSTSGSSARAGP